MRLTILNEETVGSVFRRFLDLVRGKPGFGRGVDPKNWGEVKEIIKTSGMPRVDFDKQWKEAEALEDSDMKEALRVYKRMADRHPLSGIRSQSYHSRKSASGDKLHIVIDIDNLKFVNSKIGHDGANGVLGFFGRLLEKYIENDVNDKYGKISKTFHPHGDEFNAIINLDEINENDYNEIIKFIIKQIKEMQEQFSSRAFEGETDDGEEVNKVRVTATAGIGFNLKRIDQKVDKHKKRRRSVGQSMSHLIIDDDVKPYL